MSATPSGPDPLLTPGEVAAMFRVDPKTVTRWAAPQVDADGQQIIDPATGRPQVKLASIRTPGGHRRFRTSDVRRLLDGDGN